ncbi:MAG: thrombospondin type-1 domain-containing protein [Bdellovibrionales bacterium]|nr:thrombospondin type-1 domain-containing protein [Bdellovibrionales bacterium]
MRFIHALLLLAMVVVTGSCSKVDFRSPTGDGTGGKTCEGNSNCPPGGGNETYYWYTGDYGMCSKPCGGGSQIAPTECRRTSDGVTVSDSYCNGTRPTGVRSCQMQACTSSTYSWNIGDYGTCSKTCGGGTKARTVLCQNNSSGTTVADSFCSSPKPATSATCNTDVCGGTATYAWDVKPGACSVQCGGGTATDTVTCKKSDGSTVADSFCPAPKPSTTRTCGEETCPPTPYTYAWEPQPWSVCSKDCGPGIRTRSVACKRNDGAYVDAAYCAATAKPSTQETCKEKDCPAGGTPVNQTATVTPAQNLLDVILVVDDSASMKEDQNKLASRLIQFVNDLDALNIDYQICLTTTDVNYYKGSPVRWTSGQFVLNKNTANKDTVFKNTVDALGAEYSSDEQPIKSTYLMIKDFGPNSGASNAGCFRDKSTLTVIAISDEDERSVGGNASLSQAQYKPLTNENMPDTLINYVHSVFDSSGFVKPFIWNSIIVKPGDAACEAQQDSQSSPSFPGVLLAQVANKTNGQIASICDSDYGNNMKLIKDRVVNSMPGIQLQCVPLDNPIVTFNPSFTTTVTRTGDQLKFNPALPENTQVTIKYTCPN